MGDDVDPEDPRPDGHYHVDRDADWYYVDDDLAGTIALLICRTAETGRSPMSDICSNYGVKPAIERNYFVNKRHLQTLYCVFPRFYMRALKINQHTGRTAAHC